MLHRCTGRACLALFFSRAVIKEELQGAVSQRAVSAQTSNSSLKNPLTPTQRLYSPLSLTPNFHPFPSLCPWLRSKQGLGIFHFILLFDHFQYCLCLCPGWKHKIDPVVVIYHKPVMIYALLIKCICCTVSCNVNFSRWLWVFVRNVFNPNRWLSRWSK